MPEPLVVRAHLRGAIAIPNGTPALDGLLMYAAHQRDVDDILEEDRSKPDDKPIPIAMSPCGRVYLCSVGHCEVEEHEGRWVNRKFPVAEAQSLAEPGFTRIRINAGAQKSYRQPLDTVHLVGDVMTWWCLGDANEIRALLVEIRYLGKKRDVGLGTIARWEVERCESWDGFPVVRDGKPLRTLPTDWPGLYGHLELAHKVLRPAYSRHWAEELCAVPRVAP
jgi:hypothetical protein